MEVVYECCCGLDVHAKTVVACLVTKERKCKTCGRTFRLQDHGHPGARAAADALERGRGYDSSADYFAVAECPDCAKRTKGDALAKAILEVAAETRGKKWWQFWK